MYKHARNYHTFTQKRFILVYPDMFIDVDSRFHGPKAKGVAAQWPLCSSSLSSLGSSEVAFKNVALFGAL